MDPFGATCDPRLYVARLGSEAALTALREGFATGRRVSVLSGPPGLGKTMVLQVLAEQLAPTRCVYLPYAALGIEELAQVALDALGEAAPAERATVALAAFARRAPSEPLVLLLDDASALPAETARALSEIAEALGSALRVVAAAVDDARASAALAALGGDVLHVRLRNALTPREVHAYVRGRIERAGAAETQLALRDEQLDWLAEESAGVPRVVNTLATLLLRAQAAAAERLAPVIERAVAPGATREIGADAAQRAGGDPEPRNPESKDAPPATSPEPDAAPAPPRRRRRRLRRTRGWY